MTHSADRVRSRLAALRSLDVPVHGGRTLAYVYDSGLAEADAVGREALAMFAGTNGLDPTAFPSLLAMENVLVARTGRLLDAPEGFAGTVTSGGTESILLAVLAARDARPEVESPSMVVADTAHAAFHKAAHYFGVRLIVVPSDRSTHRADASAMGRAIDDTTVLVVASAPSYAHGVVDPIPDIATAARVRGVRCHVDACIGGWVLPWLPEGRARPWTFAVPGVSSISVDLHKYAYTPKGVSILVHRDASLRSSQFFASAEWPGYTMLNTTTQSTKSGGPLAAAWAVVEMIGGDGYRRLARQARDAALEVARAVSSAGPEDPLAALALEAPPDSTLLALRADDSCDVFTIADELAGRGWLAQPQLSYGTIPATLHLSLSAASAPLVGEFLQALRASVDGARAAGRVGLDPALASAVGSLDPSRLDDSAGLLVQAGFAGPDGALRLPERMAPVNALLDRATPHLREVLLTAFLDLLTRPEPDGSATAD